MALLILQTKALTKVYGSGDAAVAALAGVDLAVTCGEFVAIMGQSGSGKSTLLNVIGGLEPPTEGEVLIDGRALSGLSESDLMLLRRDQIGFIFQSFNLLPVLNAEENVALPLVIQGRPPAEIRRSVEEVLRLVGLWERRLHLPSALSGGQQQRVAIARATVKRPAIILADEPTGNLDSQTSVEVLALLSQAVREYGQTLLLITHDADVAAHADRVIVMHDGKVIDEKAGIHRA